MGNDAASNAQHGPKQPEQRLDRSKSAAASAIVRLKFIAEKKQRTMKVMQVLHMNKGDGETSYAKSCTVQKQIISLENTTIENVVVDCMHEALPQSMGIADLGCSSGPNCVMVISNIIDTAQKTGAPLPELRVFLNDLPENDFNSLFKLLPEFYKKVKDENGIGPENCFVSCVAGSFYGRLFPAKSMHFVHSSSSLHWLSRVPIMMKWIGRAGAKLHSELASEIRSAIGSGELSMAAMESMPLMKSVVYECLRIEPPVVSQYAKAKRDLVVESHDAAAVVKEGEVMYEFQPFATKDPMIFDRAEEFVPARFVGEEGERLLQHVMWSNGPETGSTTVDNKQCAGKDFVVLVARMFVVEIFRRYDSFDVEVAASPLGNDVNVTSLKRASV